MTNPMPDKPKTAAEWVEYLFKETGDDDIGYANLREMPKVIEAILAQGAAEERKAVQAWCLSHERLLLKSLRHAQALGTNDCRRYCDERENEAVTNA